MVHSVRELKAVLGSNTRFAVQIKPNESRVGASWPCGCNAEGPKFSALSLKACATHRIGGVLLYGLATGRSEAAKN
jgi:hypothetical protein